MAAEKRHTHSLIYTSRSPTAGLLKQSVSHTVNERRVLALNRWVFLSFACCTISYVFIDVDCEHKAL